MGTLFFLLSSILPSVSVLYFLFVSVFCSGSFFYRRIKEKYNRTLAFGFVKMCVGGGIGK